MRDIIKILKNYKLVKKDFFIMIIVWSLFQWFNLLYPKISQYLIEVIENKWSLEDLYFWVSVLVINTIIFVIWKITFDYFWIKVWFNLFSKKQLFYQEKVLNKNYKDIQNIWTWKLIIRLENWTQGEVDIFLSIINIFIEAILWWIIIIIILIFNIPELLWIILIWIIILWISNFYIRKYSLKYWKKEQEYKEEIWKIKAKTVMENLTIKLFLKKDNELIKTKKLLELEKENWIKVVVANEFYYKIFEWIIRFIEIAVYLFIWMLIIEKWEYNIAYLVMLTGYIWFLRNPIDKAISNLNRINKELVKYKKLQEFIEKQNNIIDWKEEYVYKTWKIEFRNITFWYSKKNKLFKKLHLNFLEWKKNALVGHSWGWKSTIIKILLRLYEYQTWKILLDWQELRNLKIESFYKEIWYLPQEPWIFDGTIRENMEYAFDIYNKDKNKQEKIIWEALEKAQISDMIKKLEKGLDTEVWEKWIKLSWGEKQRLAIARIFLKNPKIIILDEPTSALDSISEADITKALNALIKDRTSIVIAHRLQTVMLSDKIIVLENWKIESEGTHNELMLKSHIYKTLVDLQNGKVME